MKVTIDKNSGYCFGVEFAIYMAEETMKDLKKLYCLGDIVHNAMEVERLNKLGLEIIDREQLKNLKNASVLIRAHGEPPETYKLAIENNIELIDASCPVVLKLQNRVKNAVKETNQIIIYGKHGHPEVEGINGQTGNKAIVIMEEEDLNKVDFSKPITLFSQTTKSTAKFYDFKEKIKQRIEQQNNPELLEHFEVNDSICRQVSNREPQMEKFSQENDVIIFVSGKKSSNGKALFEVCKKFNNNSYFIENEKELNSNWFNNIETVGICGATSTPTWLMQQVAEEIKRI